MCECLIALVADGVWYANVNTLLMMFSQCLFIAKYFVTICTLLFVMLGVHVSLQVITPFKHFITCIAFVKLAFNAQRHSWFYKLNFVGVVNIKSFL